jgi:hypothetical protein
MRFRTHISNVSLLHSKFPIPSSPAFITKTRSLICFFVLSIALHFVGLAWSFVEIVRYLAVMAKVCVIKLTPDTVHFIVSGSEGAPEGVQIWS